MTEQFPPQSPGGQPFNPKAQAKADKAYAKANRPLYKKKRVLIPAALLGIAACTSATSGGGGTDTVDTASGDSSSSAPAAPAAASKAPAPKPKPAAPAIVVTAKDMIATLEGNALKAKNTYEDKRVTVSGVVGNIDASGDYFALDPAPDSFILTGIQVQTDEKFSDQIANFTAGQKVTVTGKITGVGEVLGYSLEAETIK